MTDLNARLVAAECAAVAAPYRGALGRLWAMEACGVASHEASDLETYMAEVRAWLEEDEAPMPAPLRDIGALGGARLILGGAGVRLARFENMARRASQA